MTYELLSDTDKHGPSLRPPFLREDVKKLNGGGKGILCCPGKGKFPAVKTRREIHGREARPGLPQSDAGDLRNLLSIQTRDP